MSQVDQEYDIYRALALVYDQVMEEVNYEHWADFIDEIMQTHHRDPLRILELGCGTGSLALSLDELMCYSILATDKSPEMINVARRKKQEMITSRVSFDVVDFMDLSPLHPRKFDVVLLTFDSINYLHQQDLILQLLEEVQQVLNEEGIFIFDFTTPQNSEQAIQSLDGEEGYFKNFYYHRKSRYDEEDRIHVNTFTIQQLDDDREKVIDSYQEVHKQRIYTLSEMRGIIHNSSFDILSQYEGFDLVDADDDSLRVTMTLTCPQTT